MQLLKCLTGTAIILFTSSALATLITFDDLPHIYPNPDYDPDFDILKPMPLTNQYAHLGVSFGNGTPEDIVSGADVGGSGGAAIARDEVGAVSPPQGINDHYGPGIYFTFTGDTLPDYVSFHVTGDNGVGILVNAWNDTGDLIADLKSDGWWGIPEWSTPAVPQQLMEIEGENIQKIYVGSLFDRRGMAFLDNLYFSDTRPVPEATTWAVLLTGLFGLIVGRYRRKTVG